MQHGQNLQTRVFRSLNPLLSEAVFSMLAGPSAAPARPGCLNPLLSEAVFSMGGGGERPPSF